MEAKSKFLKLTIPVVSAMALAGIILLVVEGHVLEVLLVCYGIGTVLGDLICGRSDSWIIGWITAYREGQAETDAEYGTDDEIARRFATDEKSYAINRITGGCFMLCLRLLIVGFVMAAVAASWIVRIIVSLVGWLKDKPKSGSSKAKAPSPKPSAGTQQSAAEPAQPRRQTSMSTATSAPQRQAIIEPTDSSRKMSLSEITDTSTKREDGEGRAPNIPSTSATAERSGATTPPNSRVSKPNKAFIIASASVVVALLMVSAFIAGSTAARKAYSGSDATEATPTAFSGIPLYYSDTSATDAAAEYAYYTDKQTFEPTTAASLATASPAPTDTPAPDLRSVINTSHLNYVPTDSEYFDVFRELTVVVQGTMNVRTGPDTSYSKLSTLDFGSVRTAVASSDSWFLVEYSSGSYGWVSGKLTFATWMFSSGLNKYLNRVTVPYQYLSEPMLKTIINRSGANLREGPSTDYSVVSHYDRDMVVAVIAQEGEWFFVNRSGSFGWMHTEAFR